MSRVEPPSVSVLMTCFNAQEVITAALESVKQQTLTDFELVIVDDGSTDNTLAMVERVLQRGNPFRSVIIKSVRVGRARALNIGLAESSAALVTILDADDVLHPSYLRQVVGFMAHNPEVAVASGKALLWSQRLPEWPELGSEIPWRLIAPYMLLVRNPLCHSGTTLRREVVIACGGYDESRKTQLDYELWLRLTRKGHKIAQSTSPLVGKRIHPRQAFEGRRRFHYAQAALELQKRAIHEFDAPKWLKLVAYAKFGYNVTLGSLRRRILAMTR